MKALPIDSLNLISVQSLKEKLDRNEEMLILDVRRDEEWEKGHIERAEHIYVGQLEKNLDKLPRSCPIVVYCDSSRRSNIAASILKKNGYNEVYNVLGSMTAWKNAGYEIVK
jgi:hydroxyacylglutathione hydrolase